MSMVLQTSAGGIVYKKQAGKVLWLIGQHSQHKGWVFPKGLVADQHQNERLDDAALREVEEEGGVKAKIIKLLPSPVSYIYRFEGQLTKKTVYYFLMEYVSGDPQNHDWEMSEAKFVTEEEAMQTLTYPSDKQAFTAALKLFTTQHETD